MLDKLNIFLSIIAGIVFTITCIVLERNIYFWLPNVIIFIIIFNFVGIVGKHYLKKLVFANNPIVTEEEINVDNANNDEQLDQMQEQDNEFQNDNFDEFDDFDEEFKDNKTNNIIDTFDDETDE